VDYQPDCETVFTKYGSGEQIADAALSDGVVLKEAGFWASGVIALLRHLESVGFDGAPRVVGDGYAADGRLAVTYIAGESPHPGAWSEEEVARIGQLLRQLHTATTNFKPPAEAVWQPVWLRELPAEQVVFGHCDTGPWNIVASNDSPRAFIDWEFAGPVDPLWELAETAWLNAQLHDDDISELHELPDAATRARQARAIIDGYGLPVPTGKTSTSGCWTSPSTAPAQKCFSMVSPRKARLRSPRTGIPSCGGSPGVLGAPHGSPAIANS
jgi:Phosphotransferase enzyme family